MAGTADTAGAAGMAGEAGGVGRRDRHGRHAGMAGMHGWRAWNHGWQTVRRLSRLLMAPLELLTYFRLPFTSLGRLSTPYFTDTHVDLTTAYIPVVQHTRGAGAHYMYM